MRPAHDILGRLCEEIKDTAKGRCMPFEDFLGLVFDKPEIILRDVFQVFHDMVHTYVGEGVDEYPDDPESINYVYYDCSRLFVEGSDHPFFADRLFANRLINHVSTFRRGAQQNRIYVFEGPHGCGKSTFLNNLLMRFEQYANTGDGVQYEIVWRLDKKELGAHVEQEAHALLAQLHSLVNSDEGLGGHGSARGQVLSLSNKRYVEVPCPSHDNPILLIPKGHRKEILDSLIQDEGFKEKLFTEKQYEWVFRESPCTICSSLYDALMGMLDSPARVFSMVFARRYVFNRRLGEGVSVYNPGDKGPKSNVLTNQVLQSQLDNILRGSNRVRYIYSTYAKTNNGIYALMDVKDHNKQRFEALHGIISEGVHKVEDMEENVRSLFLALMNPADRPDIAKTQSFSDRIIYIKIPYVLDYNTEVKIYKNVFGDQIEKDFLPKVLQNFAKVIISSRLRRTSEAMEEWIQEPSRYELYCDRALQLLKMDIYTGLIPPWLTEDDRKRFTAARRKRIIAESEREGDTGFSGRDSIKIFSEFYSTYSKKEKLITMAMVCNFFKKRRKDLAAMIPDGFLDSLTRSYNYEVLQEVKESLYSYNEDQISRDIKNYLFAVNFDIGRVEQCIYTGDRIHITEGFLKEVEEKLLGQEADKEKRAAFRNGVQVQYASRTLTQEMLVGGRTLEETELFRALRERYVHNLKENVLDPFLNNSNFRQAIKDYGTSPFKSHDRRIRDEVSYLIKNLARKYGYTHQGAKEVCIYVIDNDLARIFSTGKSRQNLGK